MKIAVAWLLRLWDSSAFRGLVLLLAAALALWAAYAWGSRVGAARAHAEDELAAKIAVAKAEAQYREKEKAHEDVVEKLRLDYVKLQTTSAVADARVVSDLESGTRRVRIPVTRCRSDAPTPGGTTARADDPATAELPGPIAASLFAIAADGDQAIRQLTALQEWARSAVALCNGDAIPSSANTTR